MRLRFTRFSVASMMATAISQVVLLACYLLGGIDPLTASTMAFLAGAVPQFLIVRRWAFGQLPRQLLTFGVVTAIGGLLSVAVVTLVDTLVGPMIAERELRALALNLVYLAGGAPIFLAKFAVLDRVLFTAEASTYDETSSTSVRAPKPVAPAVISS